MESHAPDPAMQSLTMDRLPLELQLAIYETALKDSVYSKVHEDDVDSLPELPELLAGSRILANLCKTSQALNFIAHSILQKHVCGFYELLSHVLCYVAQNGDYETFTKFQHVLQIADEWKEEDGVYWKTFTRVDESHTLDALITSVRKGCIGERNATSLFNSEVMEDLMRLPMSEEEKENNQDEVIALFCNLFSCPYITSEDFGHFFKTACEASKLDAETVLERITKTDDKGENKYWMEPKNTVIRSLAGLEFLIESHPSTDLTALLTNAISNGQEDIVTRLMAIPEVKITPTMLKLSIEHLSVLRLLATTPEDLQTALSAALLALTTSPLRNVLDLISTFPGDTTFTLTPEFTTTVWRPLLYTDPITRRFPYDRESKAHTLFSAGFYPPTIDPKNYLEAYFTPGPATAWIIIEHILSGCNYSLDALRPEDFILGAITSRGPCDPDILAVCAAYKAPISFSFLLQSITLGDKAEHMRPHDRIATALALIHIIDSNDTRENVVKLLMRCINWMQDSRGCNEADCIITRALVEKIWGVANGGGPTGGREWGVEGKREYAKWWEERGRGVVEMWNLSLVVDGNGEGEALEEGAWREGVSAEEDEEEEGGGSTMSGADDAEDPAALEAQA